MAVRALLVVCLLAATAAAAPLVKAPERWTGGANDDLVHATGLVPHFGGVHGVIEAERYDSPRPGVVLYATRVAVAMSARDPAVRAELDQLHPTGGARETEWSERFDAASRQVEARLAYRDASVKLSGRVHALIAATADRIVVDKSECLVADDADPDAAKACFTALDTIDTGIDAKDRVAIDLDVRAGSGSSVPASTTASAPTMNEAPPHVPLPPIAVPQDSPAPDRRPVIVGAGVVVLACVFWWNRRRRDRIEAELGGDNHD
jgi:hypothetical protein